jgi:hypothetical protein
LHFNVIDCQTVREKRCGSTIFKIRARKLARAAGSSSWVFAVICIPPVQMGGV